MKQTRATIRAQYLFLVEQTRATIRVQCLFLVEQTRATTRVQYLFLVEQTRATIRVHYLFLVEQTRATIRVQYLFMSNVFSGRAPSMEALLLLEYHWRAYNIFIALIQRQLVSSINSMVNIFHYIVPNTSARELDQFNGLFEKYYKPVNGIPTVEKPPYFFICFMPRPWVVDHVFFVFFSKASVLGVVVMEGPWSGQRDSTRLQPV